MNINPLIPDKEFFNNGKARFLAVYDAKHGIRRAMTGLAKALFAAGALAVVMVSVSAYAATANVPADSPLYPLKRITENVQLVLTPPSGKSQLEVSLAAKRADEIEDITRRKPSSTIVVGLRADFDNDVSSSLPVSAPVLQPICGEVASIAAGSAEVRTQISEDPGLLQRFKDRCGRELDGAASATVQLDLQVQSGILAP